MKEEYPKKNHYLKFDKMHDGIKMKHVITEEEWLLSIPVARFIKSLNGKRDPYDMGYDSDFVNDILDFMHDEQLFDEGRRGLKLGIGSAMFALWIPETKTIHYVIGFFWNYLLMVSWLPVLFWGLYIALTKSYISINGAGWHSLAGSWIGLGIGIVFHELSHGAAALNYGGHVFEVGIMIHLFMPGAYCMIDHSNVKDHFRRAQISAAGVECNLLLCGIFLCMLKLGWFGSDVLIYAATANGCVAMFNLTLIEGLDGTGIFEEFFGCDNFVNRAKALIFNHSYKARLKKKGNNGKATIAVCYVICILQLLLPVTLLMTVINVISIFL